MRTVLGITGLALLLAVSGPSLTVLAQEVMMEISSPDFQPNEMIPERFTCQGLDINPALVISNVPEGAKTLALIVDDPDAPGGTWVHWVVFNIPVTDRIGEDSVPGDQGYNDFQRVRYGGPCPPSGTHRYFFKLYALDTEIKPEAKMSKADLLQRMAGHILAQAELVGLYKKS